MEAYRNTRRVGSAQIIVSV